VVAGEDIENAEGFLRGDLEFGVDKVNLGRITHVLGELGDERRVQRVLVDAGHWMIGPPLPPHFPDGWAGSL
jgi:hypothetical protein